jgi:hypothetical protein
VGAIVRGDGRTLLVAGDIVGNVALDIIERRTQVAIYSTTFAPGGAGPVYNTPQVDNYWGLDLIGYNFRFLPTVAALGAAAWKGGRTYDHVYRFTTTSDGVIRAIFRRHVVAGAV